MFFFLLGHDEIFVILIGGVLFNLDLSCFNCFFSDSCIVKISLDCPKIEIIGVVLLRINMKKGKVYIEILIFERVVNCKRVHGVKV